MYIIFNSENNAKMSLEFKVFDRFNCTFISNIHIYSKSNNSTAHKYIKSCKYKCDD